MNELALFAGAGGGILGGYLLGWRCVCAVELNAFAASVLVARQNEGVLPIFPIWDDISTFDGVHWNGRIDVVSGGFPCTGIAAPGLRNGMEHPDSALWSEQARVIGEVGPRFAFVENSPALAFRGGVRVIADLTRMGFECRWGTLGGAEAGMDADGQRMWILAKAAGEGWPRFPLRHVRPSEAQIPETGASGDVDPSTILDRIRRHEEHCGEPAVLGKPHGLAYQVDRLAAIGNGQVPAVVRLAWETLTSP